MKKRLVTLCVMALVATTLFAQADLQPLVTIKLNRTESITLKNLKARVAVYQKQTGLTSFTVDQKKEILDSLINEKLILQAATKAGLTLTDTQVNELYISSLSQMVGQTVTEAQFASIVREQYNLSLEEFFQQQLAMSVAEYKSHLKTQYIAQQFVLVQCQNELEKIAATDSEVRNYYEMNKASFYQTDILKMFLMVAPKGDNPAAARQLLYTQYEGVKNGTITIDQLRVKVSADPVSMQAGDMYVSKNNTAAQQLGLSYNDLLALFENANGYVSDFNETQTDYQFYIIQNKYDGKILTLSDVVQPDSNVTVYELIRSQLTAQKQNNYFTNVVSEVTASLRTPENFQMLKTGDALNKLLENW